MDLQRITVKLFVESGTQVDFAVALPLFHRWIQGNSVEGVLIDVVDYQHVENGPGVLLIGLDCDYAWDNGQGEPGVLYRQKREFTGDFRQLLQHALRRAVRAATLSQNNGLKIAADRIKFTVEDRLRAPNTRATFEALRSDIEAALALLFPASKLTLKHLEDPQSCFAVLATLSPVPALSGLATTLAV